MELSKDLESFILDMTALARVPTAKSFITPPEFMEVFVESLLRGYETVEGFEIDLDKRDKIDDAYTVGLSFTASGFNGMQMDEPAAFIDKILIEFIGVLSNLIWGPIYINNIKYDLSDTNHHKEFLNFFGFFVSRVNVPIIHNDTSLEEIVADEEKEEGFKAHIKNKHPKAKWYASSDAMLNIAALKNYKNEYVVDQYMESSNLIGDNPEFLNRDLVYDEWISNIKFADDYTAHRMFLGNLESYSMTLSDEMLIERELVYVAKNDIRPRTMTDINPMTDTETGEQYLPAIRYNITMKVRLFSNSNKQWTIFKTKFEYKPRK